MGLFGRRGNDGTDKDQARQEAAVAKAIALRGVSARGTVEAMTATGRTRQDGEAAEYEFTVLIPTPGGDARVVVRQFLNELTLTGLAPGEPVSVMYDRDDPRTALVLQSPKYVFVPNPNAAFDGHTMIAVPAAEAG